MIEAIEFAMTALIAVCGLYAAAIALSAFEGCYAEWLTTRRRPHWKGWQQFVMLSVDSLRDILHPPQSSPRANRSVQQQHAPMSGEVLLRSVVLTMREQFLPIMALALATSVFAVIPFGDILPIQNSSAGLALSIAADVDAGVLVFWALQGLATLCALLAAHDGREGLPISQWLKDQLALGAGLAAVLLISQESSLPALVASQVQASLWWAFAQPLAFAIVVMTLVRQTQFSVCPAGGVFSQSMRWGCDLQPANIARLRLCEYLHVLSSAYVIALVFGGGWSLGSLTANSSIEPIGLGQGMLRVMILHVKVAMSVLGLLWLRRFVIGRGAAFAETMFTHAPALSVGNLCLTVVAYQICGASSHLAATAIVWGVCAIGLGGTLWWVRRTDGAGQAI